MRNMSDLTRIENAINNKFNSTEIHEIQLFAHITDYSYYPIKFSIDENDHIKIKKDTDYLSVSLHIGSKYQFLHHQFSISGNNIYQLDLETYFKTGWNPNKFLVFLNGYLLNNNLLIYIIPNFKNNYKKKKIFSTVPFNDNDKIDVYYIESNDDYMQVPVLSDFKATHIKYTAMFDNQCLIKIPNSITQNFYVINDKGNYLKIPDDYIISVDKNYIILNKKNKLEKAGVNFLYFTFSKITSNNYNLITDGELSSITFTTQISTSSTSQGIINFKLKDGLDEESVFDIYDYNNTNCLLFSADDNMFIPNDFFTVLNNKQIKLTEIDMLSHHHQNKDYILYIFTNGNINKPLSCNTTHVYLGNDTKTFVIPKINNQYLPFILFNNSTLICNSTFHQLYSVDSIYHTISFKNINSFPLNFQSGDKLIFTSLRSRKNSNILFKFDTITFTLPTLNTTSINLTSYCKNLNLTANNCLFFVNYIHIPKIYYTINNKILTFTNNYQDSYLIKNVTYKMNNNKMPSDIVYYTILYIKEYVNINDNIYNTPQFIEVSTTPTVY